VLLAAAVDSAAAEDASLLPQAVMPRTMETARSIAMIFFMLVPPLVIKTATDARSIHG
jgi:hypothetical protein